MSTSYCTCWLGGHKKADEDEWHYENGVRSHRHGHDTHKDIKDELENHHNGTAFDELHIDDKPVDAAEMKSRVAKMRQQADLLQATVGRIFFVIFLSYPALTNM